MQVFGASSFYLALLGVTSVLAVPSTHSFERRHVVVERQSSSGSSSSSSSSSGSSSDAVSPLTPATTNEGKPLLIQWDTTTNEDWKSMEIKFMTGSNQQMTELYTVATGVDGTSDGQGALSWTAPQVEPNSNIYFFQFTHDGQDPTWTTRFIIADANGQYTTPPEANQPEGGSPAIPWGEGKLVGATSSNSTSSSSSSSASSSSSSSSSSTSTATPTSVSSSATLAAAASQSTSSGIDFSKYNSGNQPSAASTYAFGSVAIVGSALAGLGALLL